MLARAIPKEGAVAQGYGVPLIDPGEARFTVKLDGMPLQDVVAYSVPKGWVVRHLRDSLGRFVRKGDQYATEKLDGEVELTPFAAPAGRKTGAHFSCGERK